MGKLDGNVALVTGGGRGIGRAIAHGLAKEGCRIAVSSRTREELERVVDEIDSLGGIGFAVTADASTNSLVVMGSPLAFTVVQQVLTDIDREPPVPESQRSGEDGQRRRRAPAFAADQEPLRVPSRRTTSLKFTRSVRVCGS